MWVKARQELEKAEKEKETAIALMAQKEEELIKSKEELIKSKEELVKKEEELETYRLKLQQAGLL